MSPIADSSSVRQHPVPLSLSSSLQPHVGGTAIILPLQRSRQAQGGVASHLESHSKSGAKPEGQLPSKEVCFPPLWESGEPPPGVFKGTHLPLVAPCLCQGLPLGEFRGRTSRAKLRLITDSISLCAQHLPHPHLRAPWARSRVRGGRGDPSLHCGIRSLWVLGINARH